MTKETQMDRIEKKLDSAIKWIQRLEEYVDEVSADLHTVETTLHPERKCN